MRSVTELTQFLGGGGGGGGCPTKMVLCHLIKVIYSEPTNYFLYRWTFKQISNFSKAGKREVSLTRGPWWSCPLT